MKLGNITLTAHKTHLWRPLLRFTIREGRKVNPWNGRGWWLQLRIFTWYISARNWG